MAATNDTAQLLSDIAGYSVAAAGGVSGLPVVNGFADDRLKIRIDGMELTSACANHMNAPLSYVDPKQVSSVSLMAGVTPVSVGGDSIGGTIDVKTAQPVYAAPGARLLASGNLSLTGRSVDRGFSAGITATVADENLSAAYNASQSQAQSYKTGDGEEVLDTLYKSDNQSLLLAARGSGQQVTLRIGEQHIPYQGFPNEYMDMTGNHGRSAALGYEGKLGDATLTGELYWQDTDHDMGFISPERTGMMPMNSQGRSIGYTLKADLPLGSADNLRIGNEYHAFRLNEVWPAAPDSMMTMSTMMMGPLNYVDINNGTRDRAAVFGEWEHRSANDWTTLLGMRGEVVKMDTGNVEPYSLDMMDNPDAMAAADFNQRSHARRDDNVDLTALARYDVDPSSSYELGLARKTRSPNLYERYSWSQSAMAMPMTNWFGDGNGYVGNPDLKPEVAYNLSASADWHGPNREWEVKLNPYYSRVHDYIDADVIGNFNPYMVMDAQGNLLQFANHDATLYGLNASWKLPVFSDANWGQFHFAGIASLTRGKRNDGGNLYHMMPPTATLALEHAKGEWRNTVEAVATARKSQVDADRLEPETAGYTLLNLRSAYRFSRNVQITAGISNVFDRRYDLPLGGMDLAAPASSGMGALQPMPGYGRSLDLGLSVGF